MVKISLALSSLLFATSMFGATKFITIGTGSLTGTYYPTGGAICRLANAQKDKTNIRCNVESTGGSVYNINTIASGELNFATVQSDNLSEAYNGVGKFDKKPIKEIRSVMAIYPELVTFVVRKDSGIKSVADLKGKKFNIGNPGSGTETGTLVAFEAMGIKKEDLGYIGVQNVGEAPSALKDKKIDGYSYVVGHPTANITDAATSSPITILDIKGKKVDEIVAKHDYYSKGIIAKSEYAGLEKDVETFGLKAVLATSSKESDEAVIAVIKAVLDNFDEFKNLHPAFKTTTKESLVQGLGAPLHKAAEKYYREIGLLK